MKRCTSQQRMSSCRQVGFFEFIECGENEAGVRDGIDAYVVAGTVRSASGELYLRPDETSVRGTDRQLRRLGENRCLGGDAAREQRAHTETFVLLISDGRDDYLSECVVTGQFECAKSRYAHCGYSCF